MTTDGASERRFIDEAEAFDVLTQESASAMKAQGDWYARFKADLERRTLEPLESRTTSLVRSPAHRGLAQQWSEVRAATHRHVQGWPGQWARLQDAHALADVFHDRVLVLVYGKINAGKSSFCNFIADRYLAYGKAVSYFHLAAGHIADSTGRLREGGTETTTEVQGVRLGDKLVLLDTPGLHSVSTSNAELTRRFTESADLMLWLTSSSSPGQVQELEELGRELRRHKVLLPVLTRSDVYEEDEIDGELSRVLRNKTPQNRALQETDVLERAIEKLVAMKVDPALVKAPVSVSVLAAREHGSTNEAMRDAGFDRLYDALLTMAGSALAYKQRKRSEVFLHYLEEVVLGALRAELQALLAALSESSKAALDQLEPSLEQVERAVWRRVMPTLPDELEKHSAAMDEAGLLCAMTTSIYNAYVEALQDHCRDYDLVTAVTDARIELDESARYERVVLDEGDPLRDRPEAIGVSWERLYASLDRAMRSTLQRLSSATIRQCRSSVEQVMDASAELGNVIERYADELSMSISRSARID